MGLFADAEAGEDGVEKFRICHSASHLRQMLSDKSQILSDKIGGNAVGYGRADTGKGSVRRS